MGNDGIGKFIKVGLGLLVLLVIVGSIGLLLQ